MTACPLTVPEGSTAPPTQVFIDNKGKDIWRESKRTTWIYHNLQNQRTNETAEPVINWTDSHHVVER